MLRLVKDVFWRWLFHYKHQSRGCRTILKRIIDSLLLPRDLFIIIHSYRECFGLLPNLLSPTTFNEKLQHRKLFERRELFTCLADKLNVREYVAERVGSDYLTKIFWTGTDLAEARSAYLPARFVIKANHSTRTILFVTDISKFEWDQAVQLTQEWLVRDVSFATGEWHYRWIPPTLFIEEYLQQSPNSIAPTDYKFFVFNGVVRAVQVIINRFTNIESYFTDRSLDFIKMGRTTTTPLPSEFYKPKCIKKMIDVAEQLSQPDVGFQRVDLYEIADRIVFGEITFVPTAGLKIFSPQELDRLFGEYFRR